MDKGAVVYVSGPQAEKIQGLGSYGFSVKVLGPAVAQASAFKVVYAGLTKGLQGLFVELLMAARSFGLLDEILKRYEESFPGLLDKVNASIVALRIHAGRRAEEMESFRYRRSRRGFPLNHRAVVSKRFASRKSGRGSGGADSKSDLDQHDRATILKPREDKESGQSAKQNGKKAAPVRLRRRGGFNEGV
jgi:hypothetical protein